jgi:sugar lactone lactonase YvrE
MINCCRHRQPGYSKMLFTVAANRTVVRVLLVQLLFLVPCHSSLIDGPGRRSGASVTKLVRGSALSGGANGIFFDRRDRLYVASVFGREIVVMNRETGAILGRIGPENGVEVPDDLTFGQDGSLYWTSITDGKIAKRTPAGVTSEVANLSMGVNPITFSEDGRLFVSNCFFGDGLYEIDPSGVGKPRTIFERLPRSPKGNCTLNAMDFGPDGYLYGPRFFNGVVVRIDVDAGTVRTVATGFQTPNAVKFNSKGVMHVLDSVAGTVWRVRASTGEKQLIAKLDELMDNLAFDSTDRLFVSYAGDGAVVEVLPDSSSRVVTKGGLSFPGGVAVTQNADNEDSVWVADHFTLYEFSGRTGRTLTRLPIVIGTSALAEPLTVANDGQNLLFTSWITSAVQVWDPTTQTVIHDYRNFEVPLNAVRFRGDLIVAQFGPGNVVRASPGSGATDRVVLVNDTEVPTGLAATDSDVWIADWATGRILQVIADGVQLMEPKTIASNLSNPEGMAVTKVGALLVVESGSGKLVRIDPKTRRVVLLADGLQVGRPAAPKFPPSFAFSGVAVGASGVIYVTGDRSKVLYKIDPR